MSLVAVAQQTVAIAERGGYAAPSGRTVDIGASVAAAVEGTRLYRPAELEALVARRTGVSGAGRPAFEVTREKTGAAARRLFDEGRADVAALNFASAKNAGGGFLRGARAQEEDLARCSALYTCLRRAPDYYAANRACGTALYTDHMVDAPRVPFFRSERLELLEAPFEASRAPEPARVRGAVRASRHRPRRLVMQRRSTRGRWPAGVACLVVMAACGRATEEHPAREPNGVASGSASTMVGATSSVPSSRTAPAIAPRDATTFVQGPIPPDPPLGASSPRKDSGKWAGGPSIGTWRFASNGASAYGVALVSRPSLTLFDVGGARGVYPLGGDADNAGVALTSKGPCVAISAGREPFVWAGKELSERSRIVVACFDHGLTLRWARAFPFTAPSSGPPRTKVFDLVTSSEGIALYSELEAEMDVGPTQLKVARPGDAASVVTWLDLDGNVLRAVQLDHGARKEFPWNGHASATSRGTILVMHEGPARIRDEEIPVGPDGDVLVELGPDGRIVRAANVDAQCFVGCMATLADGRIAVCGPGAGYSSSVALLDDELRLVGTTTVANGCYDLVAKDGKVYVVGASAIDAVKMTTIDVTTSRPTRTQVAAGFDGVPTDTITLLDGAPYVFGISSTGAERSVNLYQRLEP